MQMDIVLYVYSAQQQIGLLYISGLRSSSKWGGCLAQPDPKNKGSLEDNFSWPNGPQSCLK